MQQSWRQIVLRSPVGLTVAAVAACSVTLSVGALFALTAAFHLGFDGDFPMYVGIAVAIPLMVSVPVSWFIVRLLREVEAAREQAQRQAWQDDLTGLYNRRRFAELAQRELELARRNGRTPMAVVMDLDDFKLINDRHGHAFGDRLLAAAAQAIGQALRGTDLAARWGGEEFALLLPHSGTSEGIEVVDRVLLALRALRIEAADGRSVGCTASIGVAAPLAHSECFERLIERADRAMYRAKLDGKNRVVRADARDSAPAPLASEALSTA
jgi:two-component system, cell cycle response regulator